MHGRSLDPRGETPAGYHAPRVWAGSLSIASTQEVASLSFPTGTEMFQFPALAFMTYVFSHEFQGMTPGGFSHSETHGSKLVKQLPVAYRSLPRPSSPVSA